jgi:hypothetical protein
MSAVRGAIEGTSTLVDVEPDLTMAGREPPIEPEAPD